MEKLPDKLTIRGLQIEAELVRRTNYKAWYKRADGYHEVFHIKIYPAQTLYGRKYPEREAYPSNEAFGAWAWCYKNKAKAEEAYNNIKPKKANKEAKFES
jgi:hypothetical protein